VENEAELADPAGSDITHPVSERTSRSWFASFRGLPQSAAWSSVSGQEKEERESASARPSLWAESSSRVSFQFRRRLLQRERAHEDFCLVVPEMEDDQEALDACLGSPQDETETERSSFAESKSPSSVSTSTPERRSNRWLPAPFKDASSLRHVPGLRSRSLTQERPGSNDGSTQRPTFGKERTSFRGYYDSTIRSRRCAVHAWGEALEDELSDGKERDFVREVSSGSTELSGSKESAATSGSGSTSLAPRYVLSRLHNLRNGSR
jgi:hypothetical protein